MGEGLCWGPFYLIQDFHWYIILDCLCLILSAFMFRVCHNLVFEDFDLIAHFLRYCCHQTFLRQCSCKRQDCTIFLDSTFDIDLGNASLYPLCSMPMLHRDSEASFFLRMAVFWSPRHWWFYNDSTAAKLSESDASSPAQGWMLNTWAKLALKFFEGTRPASGFLPLEDCVELAGCKGWVASSFQKQSSMSSNSLGSQTCIWYIYIYSAYIHTWITWAGQTVACMRLCYWVYIIISLYCIRLYPLLSACQWPVARLYRSDHSVLLRSSSLQAIPHEWKHL